MFCWVACFLAVVWFYCWYKYTEKFFADKKYLFNVPEEIRRDPKAQAFLRRDVENWSKN